MFEMIRLFDRRWFVFFFVMLVTSCNPQRAMELEEPGEFRATEERIAPLQKGSEGTSERTGDRPTVRPVHRSQIMERKNIE